ncbi:alpha/beta hydrolase [Paenibacillus sp. Marseille-Q4541]|uniref:alpha/beta fold hydrolase n=1 Tax=Paenibacillus sp. Marseille-Q4541 TaxID=2831522 RepID=UPI001BA8C814|nr:alpha/beta hydrolase [Paenibacillus sp. Marseille-Q4541]
MFQFKENQRVTRKYFQSGPLQLSYLDYGGEGSNVLLMLHGHMGDAKTFSELAPRLKGWRVLSLDQRGHGWSDHPSDRDYTRESYLQDIYRFIQSELHGQQVTILGHSLGGANAYQFAAKYPELVQALVIEDIGVIINSDMSFTETLPNHAGSLKQLRDLLTKSGVKSMDYFMESIFEDETGWGFRTDLRGITTSVQHINGDWWKDWMTSICPSLLIHGGKSFVLDKDQAELMAERRANTKLAHFEGCGHGVHLDDPEGYYVTVAAFLEEVLAQR